MSSILLNVSDTKIDLATMGESVADVLGTSSVIINDLKLKRMATYEFDLEKASKVKENILQSKFPVKILTT